MKHRHNNINPRNLIIGGTLALASIGGVLTPSIIKMTEGVLDAYSHPHLLQPDVDTTQFDPGQSESSYDTIRDILLDLLRSGASVDDALKHPVVGPFISATVLGSGYTVSEAMQNPLYPFAAAILGVEAADKLDSGAPIEEIIGDPACYSQNMQGTITDNCGAGDLTPQSIEDLDKYKN